LLEHGTRLCVMVPNLSGRVDNRFTFFKEVSRDSVAAREVQADE
jgi:hypothetical protein